MDNTELIRALRSAAATTGLDAYVELMQKAADALSPIRPIAAPVTDDEIDAAFEECGVIGDVIAIREMRSALQGFAAGRTEGRTAMTPLQINSMMNNMGTYDGDYEDAIVRAVEKHHEIKGATQ